MFRGHCHLRRHLQALGVHKGLYLNIDSVFPRDQSACYVFHRFFSETQIHAQGVNVIGCDSGNSPVCEV